jgi:phosphoribosylformylglycinamidine synthase II
MRLEKSFKPQVPDGRAHHLLQKLVAQGLPVSSCRVIDVFLIRGIPELPPDLGTELLCDSVAEFLTVNNPIALKSTIDWVGAGITPESTVPASPGKTPEANHSWDLALEISYKPGVTDPVALTARQALELQFGNLPDDALVQQARQYLIWFHPSSETSPEKPHSLEQLSQAVARELYNPLIQSCRILTPDQLKTQGFPQFYPQVQVAPHDQIETYLITSLTDQELLDLSTNRLLALTLEEMKVIQAYYQDPQTQAKRKELGLPQEATDIELEMLGQSWSEHCKHKIFAATIDYQVDGSEDHISNPTSNPQDQVLQIKGLFRQYIKRTTDDLSAKRKDLRSVFHDNSGVVDFDENTVMCFKAETHNSPSALDPYGGAITGIVGVNRDIMGTGKGAWPFFNTNVLCFGYPETPKEKIPEGLLHPKTVLGGVHQGIIDGGNQSGIPTVAGAFLFDESYLGKPLVFCGTGGLMPRTILGEESWVQHVDPGDLAVMAGGRIGLDGIHGATFSSLELDESSPTSAVQIGDPITQRRMLDFLMEARDLGLYKGITDNGAGGLSSSLGEMAQYSGGIRVDLDKAPLKYSGLAPWEIWVSESQERMSLAVDPKTWDQFLALAKDRGVEVSIVGEFTNSGYIDLTYKGNTIGLLTMEFVHEGLPAMNLKARWIPAAQRRPLAIALKTLDQLDATYFNTNPLQGLKDLWLTLLAEPNIRSKESLVRQYDHEVQGRSVVKPFTGTLTNGPTDGGVLQPKSDSYQGVTVTHGICPRVSDDDAYSMAVLAVDEAYRSHIALGGDPDKASGLDNFCWPDPVASATNPDGEYKLAQLVRANQGLRDACLAYNLPLVSGKDSMKNDVRLGGVKVSVRPTLLVSLFGIVPDIRKIVSSDAKTPGDLIYCIGTKTALWGRGLDQRSQSENQPVVQQESWLEQVPETSHQPLPFALGGSFLEKLLAPEHQPRSTYGNDHHLGAAPKIDLPLARKFYDQVHQGLNQKLFRSIHDVSDGGLALALSESLIGGQLGCSIDLTPWLKHVAAGATQAPDHNEYTSQSQQFWPLLAASLFNEEPTRFVVTLSPEHQTVFEGLFDPTNRVFLGTVEQDPRLVMTVEDQKLQIDLHELNQAWNSYGQQMSDRKLLPDQEHSSNHLKTKTVINEAHR